VLYRFGICQMLTFPSAARHFFFDNWTLNFEGQLHVPHTIGQVIR